MFCFILIGAFYWLKFKFTQSLQGVATVTGGLSLETKMRHFVTVK